jgi:iron-sulfur cluster repair protein YtfE (RIC family)
MLKARSAGDPQADFTSLVLVHRAIRDDLGRLTACLGEIADQGAPPPRVRAVGRYTAALLAAIRAHHRYEDDIIWPVIAATARQAVDLTPLTDDHQAIEAAVGRAGQALASFTAEPGPGAAGFRASVRALRDLLDEHIADEEQYVFPAIRRYLPADAYRWCEQQIRRQASRPSRRFTVPWLARHARPDELSRLLAARGWPTRILLTATRPAYGRLEHQAFGASALPAHIPVHQTRSHRKANHMDQLHTEAEQTTWAAPEAIWALVSDATRYPEWGPWSAGGYRRAGDTSPRGPGAIQWLRSSRRAYLRHVTSIEKILEAEEGRHLAYTVIGGIPVRNYRADVTLTPVADGTHVRWAATWDSTLAGRIVWRSLHKIYPEIVAGLIAAAEKQT